MSFRPTTPFREKQRTHTTTTTTTIQSSPNFSHDSHSPTFPPPAYTTDDLLAAKYLKISHWTLLARLAVALTSLGLGAAVTGVSADSLNQYYDSSTQHEWLLPLWPTTIDLRPTHAVLGCGIIITSLSLIYTIFALIPMRNRLHTLNLLSTLLSLLTVFTTLFTTIYASTLISSFASAPAPPPDSPFPLPTTGSLLSWTCQWQGNEAVAPPNFAKICNEGSAALDMVVALIVLSVVGTAAGAVGWWTEMGLRRTVGGWGGEGGKSEVELVERWGQRA